MPDLCLADLDRKLIGLLLELLETLGEDPAAIGLECVEQILLMALVILKALTQLRRRILSGFLLLQLHDLGCQHLDHLICENILDSVTDDCILKHVLADRLQFAFMAALLAATLVIVVDTASLTPAGLSNQQTAAVGAVTLTAEEVLCFRFP